MRDGVLVPVPPVPRPASPQLQVVPRAAQVQVRVQVQHNCVGVNPSAGRRSSLIILPAKSMAKLHRSLSSHAVILPRTRFPIHWHTFVRLFILLE